MLQGEVRNGLASVFSSCCMECGEEIVLESCPKVRGPKGYSRWECNLSAVWGQMVTGGGYSQLEESMSVLGVPVMTKASFISTERDIGEWWRTELVKTMKAAGKEEKQLAEQRGDYHEGIPSITVIVDGGWSKRSHKHSYNAKSGVGIIIGKETRKLLHIGVRNKYCAACALGIAEDKHTCYKNWNQSSSEMETQFKTSFTSGSAEMREMCSFSSIADCSDEAWRRTGGFSIDENLSDWLLLPHMEFESRGRWI